MLDAAANSSCTRKAGLSLLWQAVIAETGAGCGYSYSRYFEQKRTANNDAMVQIKSWAEGAFIFDHHCKGYGMTGILRCSCLKKIQNSQHEMYEHQEDLRRCECASLDMLNPAALQQHLDLTLEFLFEP